MSARPQDAADVVNVLGSDHCGPSVPGELYEALTATKRATARSGALDAFREAVDELDFGLGHLGGSTKGLRRALERQDDGEVDGPYRGDNYEEGRLALRRYLDDEARDTAMVDAAFSKVLEAYEGLLEARGQTFEHRIVVAVRSGAVDGDLDGIGRTRHEAEACARALTRRCVEDLDDMTAAQRQAAIDEPLEFMTLTGGRRTVFNDLLPRTPFSLTALLLSLLGITRAQIEHRVEWSAEPALVDRMALERLDNHEQVEVSS